MRKDVIGLTDGFGLPDFVLKSPIARYDGNIYGGKTNQNIVHGQHMLTTDVAFIIAYFDTVLQAPGSHDVPHYHGKYIKPLTERFGK
jgi:acyl-CoA oxidase